MIEIILGTALPAIGIALVFLTCAVWASEKRIMAALGKLEGDINVMDGRISVVVFGVGNLAKETSNIRTAVANVHAEVKRVNAPPVDTSQCAAEQTPVIPDAGYSVAHALLKDSQGGGQSVPTLAKRKAAKGRK